MEKIPTLFKRDPDDMKRVLPEVNPGCEWVLAGEGSPTRKYDGTCVMFDGERWWARREVKPGKQPPAGFQAISTDENTGKTVGWEPIEQSPFAKFHAEALGYGPPLNLPTYPHFDARTYELIGPKINGNPEKVDRHTLRSHDYAASVHAPFPVGDVEGAYEALREILTSDVYDGVEGIVWHHPDGRMAKAQGARLPARGDEVGASDPRERNGGWDG